VSTRKTRRDRPTFDPFAVLSAEERERHLSAYGRFLAERDGEPDVERRILPRREAWLAELEKKPVVWHGEVDGDGFASQQRGERTGPLDARTVWLVAIAKSNEGERYGVEIELARFYGPDAAKERANADRLYLHLMLEEHYHTKILLEACRSCGLSVTPQRPPWTQRWLIHGMQYLPERLRWIPVLAGEVLGTAVFRRLYDSCHLFAEEPEVEARLRELLGEIALDEALHVAYLRARLGPVAVRIARWLLPLVAASVTRGVPQLTALGCSPRELLADLRAGLEIPPGVDWIAPDRPPVE
jgi:hypothetical protein